MRLINIILYFVALSTGTRGIERQVRTKALKRSNPQSKFPTSPPTASQSTRVRTKASKRSRRPIVSPSPSSLLTASPSIAPSMVPSAIISNSPSFTPSIIPSSSPLSTLTASPSTHPSVSPSASPINSSFKYHWGKTTKLTVSDGTFGDRFGYSTSISNNIAIVGAYLDGDQGSNSGSAYVMERDVLTGNWMETAKLVAPDGAANDSFGRTVAVSGNVVIIGAYEDDDKGSNSGSAYVYEEDDSTGQWNQMAKLTASDGEAGDRFGVSVSVSGNIAIIGAYRDEDAGESSGSAYVFEKDVSTGHWNQTAKLTASDGAPFAFFGVSVSVSGNIAIVGADQGNDDDGVNSGYAYVFEKDDSTGQWNQAAKLLASDGASDDAFGLSVSISGNTAIIGAYQDNDNGSDSGSAYVFEKDDSSGHWNEAAKLTASDGARSDFFGVSVSVSGRIAIVGADLDDDNGEGSGSAYVFERDESTGNWNETAKLTASDGRDGDSFGYSVSASDNTVIVGAFGDDDNGAGSGSVSLFEMAQMFV